VQDAPHTLSIFDEDLDQLWALVSEMGGWVEASIHESVTALVRGDEGQALAVIESDRRIDQLAAEIERHANRMIALRMPPAGDLRDVLASIKISMLISRMGDCAKNIGHRVPLVGDSRACDQVKLIQALEAEVSAMVKAALDGFVDRSPEAAIQVRDRDDKADDYHACIFRGLVAYMQDHPDRIPEAAHLLIVAQKLERIGDHATAIAEMVHFALTGTHMPAAAVPDGGSLMAAG
jgi:phosphate transport system protein